MTPKPEGWLERVKKTEPVKLARTAKAFLAVLSLLGYVAIDQTQVAFLGTQLEVILPFVGAVLWPVVEWVSAWWLRRHVSAETTTEPMAVALEAVQTAQAKGQPAPRISEAANRAKNRVLGRTEDALPNVNVEPL